MISIRRADRGAPLPGGLGPAPVKTALGVTIRQRRAQPWEAPPNESASPDDIVVGASILSVWPIASRQRFKKYIREWMDL